MRERTHEKRSLQKAGDSTSGEHQKAQARHHSERAAPASQKKVRADLHRSALTDSRTLTLEEVRAEQASSEVGTLDTRHPAQVEGGEARHDLKDQAALTVVQVRLAHADLARSESRPGRLQSRNARHTTPGSG